MEEYHIPDIANLYIFYIDKLLADNRAVSVNCECLICSIVYVMINLCFPGSMTHPYLYLTFIRGSFQFYVSNKTVSRNELLSGVLHHISYVYYSN